MKIEITDIKNDVLEVGDMLVVQDNGCEPKYRLIGKVAGRYVGLELDTFNGGLSADTLENLLSDYEMIYNSVKIVKKAKIKIIGVM